MKVPISTSLSDDGSLADDLNSSVLKTAWYGGVAISAVWSAGSTPVGTLKLQASNSLKDLVSDIEATSWIDVADSSQALSGDTGSHMWDLDTNVKYLRVVFTSTSGDGTINIVAHTKDR